MPTVEVVTFNTNGLSQYSDESRRKRIVECILLLAGKRRVVCLQETHLRADDKYALTREFPGWRIVRSSLSSRSAGVVTLIPPWLVRQYEVEVVTPDATRPFTIPLAVGRSRPFGSSRYK